LDELRMTCRSRPQVATRRFAKQAPMLRHRSLATFAAGSYPQKPQI
jgi:hypothetical protein